MATRCAECNQHLEEEAYFDGDDAYYCEKCMTKLIKTAETKAATFAKRNCKITSPLPKFDPRF